MQWKGTASVAVDNGANITFSSLSSPYAINMSAPNADTSLWLNGGSLNAGNNGNLLLGTNSFIEIGGKTLGGLTSQQSGGLAGALTVGNISTVAGAQNTSLWMFGSSTQTAKLNAASINLEANNNNVYLTQGNGSELGSDINVTGNMRVVNGVGGTFSMSGGSQLTVGGDLYLDTKGGSLQITNSSITKGITVGGNLTLTNDVTLSSNVSDISLSAYINNSTVVNVAGDINVIGTNVGGTGLQMLNGGGTGISTKNNFNISSEASGNTTSVIMGHSSIVTAENNINLNSVQGGAVKLFIGDTAYGAPNKISAKSILMGGAGQNSVIFNNNQTAQAGVGGYIFNVPINGAGNVVQQTGHTTLNNVSDYTGGTVITGGMLSIDNNKALGSGDVAINTNASASTNGLDIAYSDGSDFSNILTGSGYTNVSGVARIVGDNSAYAGNWNVSGEAKTALNASTTTTGFGTGSINITQNGLFTANTTNGFVFANALTGDGTLAASNNGQTFNFSSAAGSAFAGEVALQNNSFSLAADNTTALTNATLETGSGNVTTVGTGVQNIGGLAFNGGTMVFGNQSVGTTLSNNSIETAKTLDVSGKGNVQITVDNQFVNNHPTANTTVPLLQQDEEGVMVKLAGSTGTVKGSAGNLSLIDENGNAISDAVQIGIVQNSQNVATGTYDFRLTSGDQGDGLYVNYGLTKVNLLAQGDNALVLDAGTNTGNAADLSALITGSGDLRVNTANDVTLSNSDNDYTGTTWVDKGGLKMENDNVLGQTKLLNLAANTQFDMNGYSQTLKNLNTDDGSVLNFNNGDLTVNNGTVAGTMTGAGSLTVKAGTLTISSDNTNMTADTTIASDGVVRMLANQSLGTGSVTNQGTLYLGENSAATIPTSAQSNEYEIGGLTNSGTVVIGHDNATGNAVAGTTLKVNGNYVGDGGLLLFNTELAGDNSLTDKMIVTGDTSGTSKVSVINAGGKGDKALNGIEIISVNGNSNGQFTQEGRIVAGAYDYTLKQGTGSNENNWYLVNNGVATVVPSDTADLRPEAGSYIANQIAANTLFNTTLHDRLGETQYIDALTGEKKVTSLWLRQVGNYNSWHDDSGQLKTRSSSYVAQIGGDVAQWSSNGLNRFHLGLMGGYASNHNNTRSAFTGYRSTGSLDGYSAGIYGTWFADDADKTGMYVDTWLQYGWFHNHVNGDKIGTETYKTKGVTASVESGYTFKMSHLNTANKNLFLQLQAQAVWMGVKNNDHQESNGTIVSSDGNDNIQTRLGARVYMKNNESQANSNGREFEPFVEVNWLHNTQRFGVVMDGTKVGQAGARNIGELKVGVEGKINKRLNIWGNVGTQVGSNSYNNTGAMIGVKYNF